MAKAGGTSDKTVVGGASDKTLTGRVAADSKTVVAGTTRARGTGGVSGAVPKQIGKYINIRPLGAGGMGAVYLGEDPELKRTVVIKTMLKAGSSRKARFIREAGILSGLTSQRIVRFYETMDMGDKEYVVLEYVEGMDLGKLLEKDGKLPAEIALWILREVCSGLKVAHRQLVVHRDIKPANILLSKGAQVKITDFGISGMEYSVEDDDGHSGKDSPLKSNIKIVNADITTGGNENTSSSMGTLSYMAPEQMTNVHKSDSRADIYSLGVMLYEMVTGSKPYTENSMLAQHHKISEGKYIKPSKLVKGLPRVVTTIISKTMRFKREERYSSVDKIIKKINRHLKGFNERDLRQELANSMQNYPKSQYKYKTIVGKNTRLYKILGIAAAALVGIFGIFFLVKAGFSKGFFQRLWPISKDYTPVTLHMNFPEIINAGSGFSPKAYFYTYDDSQKNESQVSGDNIEVGKWINPHTKIEVILDSSNPEDETKADQVPFMEFEPEKDKPNIYSTKTIFLKPGTYRVKVCMGPAVWWKTLVVQNYVRWAKNGKTGEVDEYLEYSLSEGRKLGFARPVVVDRNTGEALENCRFKITYNHSGKQDIAKVSEGKNKTRQQLTADEVESYSNDGWISLVTKTKNKGKDNEEKVFINPVIEVFVSCDGYRTERFGLSTDWYQDKIYINAALIKEE